jgi:predicted nucleic acid-binding Zn ribbon protein
MSGAKKGSEARFECPVCGAEVPPRARACPECGADERTGWNEESTRYDGLDLPNEAFAEDDDHALKEEKRRTRIAPRGVAVFWWSIGVGLVVVMVYLASRAGL